ncbi:hypothetical protein ACO1O0_002572 [Amphichorda felina]
MRYAAAPLGDLRFMPPQDPPCHHEPQPADAPPLACLATKKRAGDNETSEDCLFLNVMAPSNATRESKLPVYFYIQGGGFNKLSDPSINATGIIDVADRDLVVVNLNYRVGPYGFLTNGDQITPNNGLRDQRKALEWVQEHISKFGGDPDHVVIGGTSAGGASVIFHMTSENGTDRGLFHGAMAQSASFAATLTVEESQYQFNQFAIRLGCTTDTMRCLRRKTADQIQEVNINIPLPGGASPPLYQWLPVLDYDFITDYTYRALAQGKFIKVPTVFGDDRNGGTSFAPKDASSLIDSNQFMIDQYPTLTPSRLGEINDMYPNPHEDDCPAPGCYWRQASNTYQEVRYMCPALFANSVSAARSARSWAYMWSVEDPAQMEEGLGVPHTSELQALIGPAYTDDEPESYKPGGINERASPVLQGYWTSFMRTLDPNTHREGGTAEWEDWGARGHARMVIGTGGSTEMVDVEDGLKTRCEWWVSHGVDMGL